MRTRIWSGRSVWAILFGFAVTSLLLRLLYPHSLRYITMPLAAGLPAYLGCFALFGAAIGLVNFVCHSHCSEETAALVLGTLTAVTLYPSWCLLMLEAPATAFWGLATLGISYAIVMVCLANLCEKLTPRSISDTVFRFLCGRAQKTKTPT